MNKETEQTTGRIITLTLNEITSLNNLRTKELKKIEKAINKNESWRNYEGLLTLNWYNRQILEEQKILIKLWKIQNKKGVK